jgi:hypothetical protein
VSYNLLNIVNESHYLQQLYKSRVKAGDHIILKTSNSVYSIRVLKNGQYEVSGGWFDKNNLQQTKTTIHGCTWGGSIIKSDIVAACGLHLEFGNKVVTSKIRRIFHIPNHCEN